MEIPDSIKELAGWVMGVAGAAAIALSGIAKRIKGDHADIATANRNIEKASAEIDVIALLRDEVHRLAEANRELQETVQKLRTELSEVRSHNRTLLNLLEQHDGYKKDPSAGQ